MLHSNTLVCLYHPGTCVHAWHVIRHVMSCVHGYTFMNVVPVPRVPQLFNDTGAVRGACRLKISSHHAQPTIVAFLVIL